MCELNQTSQLETTSERSKIRFNRSTYSEALSRILASDSLNSIVRRECGRRARTIVFYKYIIIRSDHRASERVPRIIVIERHGETSSIVSRGRTRARGLLSTRFFTIFARTWRPNIREIGHAKESIAFNRSMFVSLDKMKTIMNEHVERTRIIVFSIFRFLIFDNVRSFLAVRTISRLRMWLAICRIICWDIFHLFISYSISFFSNVGSFYEF